MPRFPQGVQGLSEDEAAKRFEEAVEHADDAVGQAAELGVRVEKARTGCLGREQGRMIRKYGGDSPQARRAEAAVITQEKVLDLAVAGVQRARIPVVLQDDETTRVHGRVVDRRHAGIAGIDARLVDAHGKALAKAATDENGYFRLDVKPRAKSSRAKAAGRRITVPPETAKAAAAPAEWELVLLRGHQELFRETLHEVEPGQAVYREPVLDKQ